MHFAHGKMHRLCQDFWLGEGGETVHHMQQRHQIFSKRGTFMGQRMKDQKLGSGFARNQDFSRGKN